MNLKFIAQSTKKEEKKFMYDKSLEPGTHVWGFCEDKSTFEPGVIEKHTGNGVMVKFEDGTREYPYDVVTDQAFYCFPVVAPEVQGSFHESMPRDFPVWAHHALSCVFEPAVVVYHDRSQPDGHYRAMFVRFPGRQTGVASDECEMINYCYCSSQAWQVVLNGAYVPVSQMQPTA